MHKNEKTLMYNGTNRVVKEGDAVHISGTAGTIHRIVPPHKPSSTGRVVVSFMGGAREYFPVVIGASWR